MAEDLTTFHVRKAMRGDPAAVEWLVSHFSSFTEAQVRLRLRGHGTAQDVEDLVAEVWTVVLQRLGDLEPRAGRHAPVLVRFLGTTVLQTCNNFLRKLARRPHGGALAGGAHTSGPADPMDRLAAQTRGVVSRVAGHEVCSLIRGSLEELKPEQRDVLVLRLMEQRSNQTIARMLGVPPNTVAVRYRRALEALRSALPAAVWGEVRQATAAPRR